MKKVKIKYVDPSVEPIKFIDKGDWVDLRARKDMDIGTFEAVMIPLNVCMELPEGYEAHVLPRSSTFKKFGILMVNSMGIIDNSYHGDSDEWQFPALSTRTTHISKGDRIAQFRIVPKQERFDIEVVDHLGNADRGGFGSTGVR